MTCRLIETEPGVSFVAQCDCSGEWRDLERVEHSAEGFPSWNLHHAVGGHTLTCRGCSTTYALGGVVDGHGLPDLIPAYELAQIPRLELSRLQRRMLDCALVAQELLWLKHMDLLAASKAAGDLAAAEGHYQAAMLMLGAMRREQRESIRAILLEHGIDDVPEQLRIARTSDGSGFIYSVDRGRLPVRQRVREEPHRFELLDLAPFTEGGEEVEEKSDRVVDLS